MKRELLIGCGSRKNKDLYLNDEKVFENVTTLDINLSHKPDIVWDLTEYPLPFEDNAFDEIHAYEVLEHLAYQGNYEFFFEEFMEYARILKNGGLFFATVPDISSKWVWGDPSHKRVITRESLTFLSQKNYEQVGITTMSDFRYLYKADFEIVYSQVQGERFCFTLTNRKEKSV